MTPPRTILFRDRGRQYAVKWTVAGQVRIERRKQTAHGPRWFEVPEPSARVVAGAVRAMMREERRG